MRIGQRRRGVVMPCGPTGPAVRDDHERMFFTCNRAILRARHAQALDPDVLIRRIAGRPNRRGQRAFASGGRYLDEADAGSGGRAGHQATCRDEGDCLHLPADDRYAARTISRTSTTVSSIMAAVTSRCVQALIRPSITASQTPRLRNSATILSPATPAPSGLKNTKLVSGCCTSIPAICDSPRASARALA